MANTNLTGTPVFYSTAKTNQKKAGDWKEKKKKMDKEFEDALEQVELKQWFDDDKIKPKMKLVSSETVFYKPSGKVARVETAGKKKKKNK